MEAAFGRTTGNIEQDHIVYAHESLLARKKYDHIRVEENRINGVMSVPEGLACIAFFGVAVAAFNTGNPLGDFVSRISRTETTSLNQCNASGLEEEIKRLERSGFKITCPFPK